MSGDDNIVRIAAFEEAAGRRLKGNDGGSKDGGMPPTDLTERVVRIEASLDALVKAVDGLSKKVDDLVTKVGGLSERVASVEGQLKHIPTLWSVMVGQVVAAVAVAGIILTALNYGYGVGKSAQISPPLERRSDLTQPPAGPNAAPAGVQGTVSNPNAVPSVTK